MPEPKDKYFEDKSVSPAELLKQAKGMKKTSKEVKDYNNPDNHQGSDITKVKAGDKGN